MNRNDDLIAVAIPAHDEALLIGRCLDALAGQRDAGDFIVIVLANNCTDATAAIASQPRRVAVEVHEQSFAPAGRSAGHARRVACALAAERAPLILTTDADCIADPDWIAAHRTAFRAGADVIAGRVTGDPAEMQRLPPHAIAIGKLEWEYLTLRAEAEALFDPVPHDPLPRHPQCCGANLGVTRAMLEKVGGVPDVPKGEDHALIAAVERAGGRVRHAVGPHVTASARIDGRARGGMADALAARARSDYLCDEQFLPADNLVARLRERREARERGAHHRLCPLTTDERITPARLTGELARLRELMAAHG